MSIPVTSTSAALFLVLHLATCGGDRTAERGASDPALDGPSWAESTVTRAPAASTAVLTDVRFARHDGYDRFVLEFREHLPGYRIRYPPGLLHECGTGRAVELDAPAALQIELRRTAAHDREGEATTEERELAPGLPTLRDARLTCDYEGIVEWVLGLEKQVPFRVLTLQGPPRLVVDVRHR